jgi:hypothetical protein
LQRRYRQLVLGHLHVAGKLTSGPGVLAVPGLADGFAGVIGAYRFLHNDRVTLPLLVGPLHQVAHQWRQQSTAPFALLIHDWSSLKYPAHHRKTDQTQLSHGQDYGYELTTLLLVDGRTGAPVAPVELRLRTAQAVYSTRQPPPKKNAFRIDEVLPSMQAAADLGLGDGLVHVIDREADSLAHYRHWQAAGQLFLVRADGEREVRWQGAAPSLAEIGRRLQRRGQFRRCREVQYRGQTAVQHVAETTVTLDRPAWRHRRRGGRTVHERVPGEPITLRLVISRVGNERGQTLAVWYLLTNVPAAVPAETAALWYYWRWRIESFFKLLKSAGQQLEQWQQGTGAAIAKRLLVAAMACVVVWKLERQPEAAAASFRDLLVRLSGRQMKWGRAATAPALLAGLWVYLAMLEVLEHHSAEDLRAMKPYLFLTDEDTG